MPVGTSVPAASRARTENRTASPLGTSENPGSTRSSRIGFSITTRSRVAVAPSAAADTAARPARPRRSNPPGDTAAISSSEDRQVMVASCRTPAAECAVAASSILVPA